MMSIGEFAGAVALSVSAVRFYADRGLLAPATTDPTSGYRYYTQDQVPRGSMIRDLRLMDISLAEISDVLEMAPAERDSAIADHIRRLEDQLSDVRGVARSLQTPGRTTTTLRSTELARAVRQVIGAAGRDPLKPHHMCVLIEVRDNSLRIAATDSYRLAVRDLVPASIGRMFSIVVAAESIRSWPDALDVGGDIALEVDGATLAAHGTGIDLRCPPIPIEFPDYETVLQTSVGLSTTVVVDRQQFMTMLGSFDGNGAVMLTASDSTLVATRDETMRHVTAEISSDSARVAINPRFAVDAGKHAVGNELIIEIDGALSPLTFRSADDGTYSSMLMPVRLD